MYDFSESYFTQVLLPVEVVFPSLCNAFPQMMFMLSYDIKEGGQADRFKKNCPIQFTLRRNKIHPSYIMSSAFEDLNDFRQ